MVERVVVTGGGVVSSLGDAWPDIRAALASCKNRVRYMHEWDCYPELHTRLASPVDDFVLPDHYGTKKKRSMGRVAQMGVYATERALADAGLLDDPVIGSGATGVAYGSATGSSAAAMEFFSLLEHHSMQRINGTTYLRMMSHSAAVNISVNFKTTGRMYTTCSACTAGSQAIGYAYEAIRAGQQQVMIAGGAEELCPTQAAVFDTVYATSTRNDAPHSAPRPFDAGHDGLVLGEGACTLILESLSHARARGARILAEVIGYGTNTDGAHLVKPKTECMADVMRLALRDAGLPPEAVNFISGHGTATVQGDNAEAAATRAVMGSKIPFSALKSYIGHSLGACASLEALLTIYMMNDNWFAPTLNLHTVDAQCEGLNYIVDQPLMLEAEIFMSNNFAFGGINTSLLLRRWK